MLRRSLQILLAATMLALAVVVGYAVVGVRNAADTLADAERAHGRGEHAQAIAILDLAEGAYEVRHDSALRERLYRLRLAANNALENPRGALEDVDNLLAAGAADDLELQLERIRLRIEVGDGARARQLARTFAGDHPEHARGLELAGAACAAAYGPTEAALRESIRRDVGSAQAAAADDAFATYLHCPPGDPALAQAGDALARLYATDARLAARWPTLLRDLRALRDDVQEALDYCRRSLELGGAPSSAVVQWGAALAACGRVDDALVACEIHRRRPADAHTADAGLVAARTLLQRGDDAAAVATVDRWLPQQLLQARLDAGTLGDAAQHLLLVRAVAAWRLGDVPTLRRTLGNLGTLHRAGVTAPVPLHLAAGMAHYLNQQTKDSEVDRRNCETNLRYVARLLRDAPVYDGQPDLLSIAMPLRLEVLARLGEAEAELLGVYDEWQTARPTALEPRLAFARHLLQKGRIAAAQVVVAEAAALQPAAAEVFDLRLELARAEGAETGVDGAALLAQCQRTRRLLPDVSNPLQLVLCAETALALRRWGVTRACAQAAAEAFPQWRHPRRLAIEAALGDGQNDVAAQQARRLLELFPADEATALLALRASRAAGLPTRELLVTAMPACAPQPDLQSELLRVALADDPTDAAVFAAGVRSANTPATLRLLGARAQADAGAGAAARELLESVLGESDALPADARDDLTAAVAAWVAAAAAFRDDASLRPEVARMIARTDPRTATAAPVLLRTAAAIAATHPGTAHELVLHALAVGTPASRDGAAFALAGRLSLQAGQTRLAEEQWLAALAFADGRSVAEDLARLLLAQGRSERALQVYALAEAATDAALAARLGATERAAVLVAAALAADPMDLLAQATAALFGLPSQCDWQVADTPTTERRLELLTLLRDPDLAAESLARARALVDETPASVTSQLLLARAAARTGAADEATDLHLAVLERRPGPMLWREVAVAAERADYRVAPPLDFALGNAVLTGDFGGSTTGMVFGLRRLIAGLERLGLRDRADDMRKKLWLLLPRATIETAADVAGVAALPDPYEAWWLLDQVLPTLDAPLRAEARERFAELADRLVRERGAAAADVYEHALQHLARDGAHGCLVHFVLAHGATFPARRPDAAATRRLLLAQLELAATGRDPGAWLGRSVDRLLAAQGPAATRDDLGAALRHHPTCLSLWHELARVRTRLRDAAAGIDDLRRVLAHADAPAATLQFLVLAGATGQLRAADTARLDALRPPLPGSPEGQLARGLVLLRSGQPDQALSLLANAPAADDGLHLFALALAHLQSRAADGGERARRLFEQLATDYASSSLARNAGSFARQLSPR